MSCAGQLWMACTCTNSHNHTLTHTLNDDDDDGPQRHIQPHKQIHTSKYLKLGWWGVKEYPDSQGIYSLGKGGGYSPIDTINTQNQTLLWVSVIDRLTSITNSQGMPNKSDRWQPSGHISWRFWTTSGMDRCNPTRISTGGLTDILRK